MLLSDYVSFGFSWFLFIACIVALVATTGKAGESLVFWMLFTLAFAAFGTADIFRIFLDAAADEWFVFALKTTGWVFLVLGVIVAIWTLNAERFG